MSARIRRLESVPIAEIDVDNAEEALRPGSYVHVELTVPADSIVLRSGAPAGGSAEELAFDSPIRLRIPSRITS